MNTEKDTCQKSGTSVIFQKEITQCRECPHCRIAPDPDPDDWFNDDDEKALCKEAVQAIGWCILAIFCVLLLLGCMLG